MTARSQISLGVYHPYAGGDPVERILYALNCLVAAYDDQYHRDETFAADALDRLAQAADDAMTDGGCDE